MRGDAYSAHRAFFLSITGRQSVDEHLIIFVDAFFPFLHIRDAGSVGFRERNAKLFDRATGRVSDNHATVLHFNLQVGEGNFVFRFL